MASAFGDTAARSPDVPARAGEDELGWERRQARPTAIAAFVAAACLLLGAFVLPNALPRAPSVGVLDGVRDALGRPLSDGQTGLLSRTAIFYADHAAGFVLVAAVTAIGYAAISVVLAYLWRAVKHRNPSFSRVALYVALIAPILLAVGVLVGRVGVVLSAGDFKDATDQSSQAARDALRPSLLTAAQYLQLVGTLGTAVMLVLIPLNAMRVGLLTRFLGILGIIAGVTVVFPIGGPIVQCYWLVAVGLVVLDKWPGAGGRPPAWAVGEAIPWPSQQELREQRGAGLGRDAAKADADPLPVASSDDDVAPAARPSTRTSRKRKRR